MLRHHRSLRGWTQLELAIHAGYSERVIRKAEAGGPVRGSTLDELAEALSTEQQLVTSADLRGEPLAVVKEYYRMRKLHSYDAPRYCAHLFHDDYVLQMHREDAGDLTSGVWYGVEGLRQMYQQIKTHYRPLGESIRFYTAPGGAAAIRYGRSQPIRDAQGRALGPDAPITETWIAHEWTVTDGKIYREHMYTDSSVWRRAMKGRDESQSEGN